MNTYTRTVVVMALTEGTQGMDAYLFFRETWGMCDKQARLAVQEYERRLM